MTGSTRRPKINSAQRRGVATISDVAAAAGVSKMTVSRVLRQPWSVREETRDRVTRVMTELHYRPNPSARQLSGTEQMRFGLLYNMPRAAYMTDFIMAAIDQATLMDIQLLSRGVTLGVDAAEVFQSMVDSGVDAVILTPPLCDAAPLLEIAARIDRPVLLVATENAAEGTLTISIDERAAAREMTDHLIALGHRRIGFIMGEPALSASHTRLDGYRAALLEGGLPVDETLIAQGYFTYRSGLAAAESLLALPEPPTAIFASNDDMAAAAVMTAYRLGYDVPGQLTVVGFDDSWIATSIYPELTTIHQPIGQMAAEGILLLAESAQSRRAGGTLVRKQVEPHRLVVRQSDGAPGGRYAVRRTTRP